MINGEHILGKKVLPRNITSFVNTHAVVAPSPKTFKLNNK